MQEYVPALLFGLAIYVALSRSHVTTSLTAAKRETFKAEGEAGKPLVWSNTEDNTRGYGPRPRVDQQLMGESGMYTYTKPDLEPMDTASIFVEGPVRMRPTVI
jgi:hypothetical protein